MNLDVSLYLVTDRRLLGDRDLAEVVAAAILGGVTCVQLREKDASGAEFVELAERLLAVTRPAGVPLIINDRVDVMLVADCDGVHLGQTDLPANRVRTLIGPDKLMGVTVSDVEELQAAIRAGADYVGSSAVFATPTKPDSDTPIGLAGLRAICEASQVPVVAIGGVDASNAAQVMAEGASGIAVVRAIMAAEDPRAAAQQLRTIVDEARAARQRK